MSRWEHVELGLARLYSIFARAPDTPEGIAGYAGTIFRERLNALRDQAGTYFVAHPDQDFEGEFDRVCWVFEKFADRRNEVAHGVVFDVSRLHVFPSLPLSLPHYALIPPRHSIKRYQGERPMYGYTSVELNELDSRLSKALDALHAYRHSLRGTLREWLEGRA